MESRNRITLNSVESKDIDTILLWENDPQVIAAGDWHKPFSREEIEKFVMRNRLDMFLSGQRRYMICLNGEAIGTADLYDVSHQSASIGILIYPTTLRGKGYASQAIMELSEIAQRNRIRLLRATVRISNLPSMALFAKLGFEPREESGDMVTFEKRCM